MVEIWPMLVDWEKFLNEYQIGEIAKGLGAPWAIGLEAAHPSDVGSENAAMIDAFKLMEPNLPADVRQAVGVLVISIATLNVEGWDRNDHVTSESTETYVYSPETVRKILTTFDAIDRARLVDEVSKAWAKIDAQPKGWYYMGEDVWGDPKYFIEYLTEWRDAFAEASEKSMGLMIDGG